MIISKDVVVDELRRRGLTMRAEFVDRQLPAEIDTGKHVGLLSTLRISSEELTAAAERASAAAGEPKAPQENA
jgi:hypothetical protein